MPLRIYLTARVLVEDSGTILFDERRLMGRQGRLAVAHLVGEHLRAVSRDELAEELWLDTVPPSWERALSALPSVGYPAYGTRRELSRSCLKGRLELREHHLAWLASTAQNFGQVRVVHPCLPGEFPNAEQLTAHSDFV